MKTATFIKQMEGFRGDARFYKLSEPASVGWDAEKTTDYVIVSAVVVAGFFDGDGGPETYIFPADGEGRITSWSEMEGSFQGGLDHTRALAGLGYIVE